MEMWEDRTFVLINLYLALKTRKTHTRKWQLLVWVFL